MIIAKRVTTKWFILLLVAIFGMTGCNQTPVDNMHDVSLLASDSPVFDGALNNKSGGNNGATDINKVNVSYPQYAERTFSYNANSGYSGGNIQVPGGTTFFLPNGALTPPDGTQSGAPVTITMRVERKNYKGKNILEFTFSPHGSQFNPPASITL